MTPGSTPIRILFAEDAFDQALVVKAFLSSARNYEVTHSQDGDSAAELLRSEKWDLFITDLNLPGMDGFELIRLCHQTLPDVPIMATTGYTGAHYQEEAFRSGASDLMTKPLDKEDFLNRVAKLVGDTGTTASQAPAVVAIGGLVGDAEMGCGGSLVEWAAQGRTVYIVPIWGDEMDASGAGLTGARAAASILGARAIIDEVAMEDTGRRMKLVERLVQEHNPEVLYMPTMDDDHPARREAFRIAKAAATKVPLVLGYQTCTTGIDFRPGRYVDISDEMMAKMEALAAYHEAGAGRMDLAPRMAQAYARYWGRLNKFTEVEAFEILKDG